ncbi:MAG: major capsid protein V20 domain-containing protein, partial [Candidatus Fonsibacter sp.]
MRAQAHRGLTCSDTDNYLTMKNISANFNNQAYLVSSMAPEELYINSVQSGLANMSWG